MKIQSRTVLGIVPLALALAACGGGQPAQSPSDETTGSTSGDSTGNDADSGAPSAEGAPSSGTTSGDRFQVNEGTGVARDAKGVKESKLKATATETLLKFIVVDKAAQDAPIAGIVISLTAPDGKKFFTEETDAKGYAEVLVPAGKKYDLVYLSLGRRDISAEVDVAQKPNQTLKLTLRYKKILPPEPPTKHGGPPGFTLDGIEFDTGKATLRPESFARLDGVLEFLQYKKTAHVVISGHTDNQGKPAANKKLSEARAQACRDYLIKKGIEPSRIEAVGYGDEQPIASNATEEGRQQNRRIEAREL